MEKARASSLFIKLANCRVGTREDDDDEDRIEGMTHCWTAMIETCDLRPAGCCGPERTEQDLPRETQGWESRSARLMAA